MYNNVNNHICPLSEINPKLEIPVQQPQYRRAMNIVNKLLENGFETHFAGGWIRDLLVGKVSDDIDIITDAPIREIGKIFDKTFDKGIDYGVLIVEEEGEKFEVAMFRKDGIYTNGRTPTKVEKASIEEDAKRRDLTVNGLLYDPIKETVHDYVGGLTDLLVNKQIRTIGDAKKRFEEDRLRVLRAVRFSVKLGFEIETNTQKAIKEYAPKLFSCLSKEIVWKELVKMSKYPNFGEGILKMYELDVLQTIFPQLSEVKLDEMQKRAKALARMPVGAPLILYMVHLFPKASKGELLKICNKFNIRRNEGRLFLQNYFKVKEIVDKELVSLYEWAKAYSLKDAKLCLKVIAARMENGSEFMKVHEQRMKKLFQHVERIKKRKPLVTVPMLEGFGLQEGKKLGELLREAERIAVNQDLNDVKAVLEKLQQTKLWIK